MNVKAMNVPTTQHVLMASTSTVVNACLGIEDSFVKLISMSASQSPVFMEYVKMASMTTHVHVEKGTVGKGAMFAHSFKTAILVMVC